MKSINKIMILLLAVFAFASCQTEHLGPTINPEAEAGTLTFVLNKPMYANMTYVLLPENNALPMEVFTTSQPDFGFTAAVTYFVEISRYADMRNFVTLGPSFTTPNITLTVRDMNMGIFNMYEGNMPNPTPEMTIFMRLRAVINSSTASPLETELVVKPAFSNVIELQIQPFFVPNLTTFCAVPGGVFPFFIIGYNGWDNSMNGLDDGSLIPMSVIAGDHYNADGQGTFVFTGYFEAGRGFKLIGEIGSWALEWGGTIDEPQFNVGGSPNLTMPESGYWTITLNTIDNILTFEQITIEQEVFSNMGVVGTITNWGGDPDIEMTPLFQTNNHVWRANVTITDVEEDRDALKFRYNSDWGVNWGVTSANQARFFPRGLAVRGNADIIPTETGTFTVFFNDIDGSFTFIRRQ